MKTENHPGYTSHKIDPFESVETLKLVLDPGDPMRSARRLVASRFSENGTRLLHHHRGAFWQFTGNHYAEVDDKSIRTEVWTFLETAFQKAAKGEPTPFKPNTARVSNVVDALAAASHLDNTIEPPAWLNETEVLAPASEMLPVANGLLHLPSGKIISPTANYFGLNASAAVFDPNAPEPAHWLAFLDDLFKSDIESIEALQDWFGYVLSPDTSQQKMLLIVGPKRSGKGTIGRILKALLGNDNVVGPTLAGLQTNFGLSPLIAKPLAIISDARLGYRTDQANIAERLLSISGEDTITIDRKYGSAWTGQMPTRFMVLTNELPRIADTSGALASRFIVLLLENSFYGKEDHTLFSKLSGELSGILNWGLIGYRIMHKRGYFKQPASARDAAEEIETLGSPMKAFIRERCRIGAECIVSIELIYLDWCRWCENNGRKEPGTKQSFGRDLKAALPGVKVVQPREGEKRTREYQGIDLVTP